MVLGFCVLCQLFAMQKPVPRGRAAHGNKESIFKEQGSTSYPRKMGKVIESSDLETFHTVIANNPESYQGKTLIDHNCTCQCKGRTKCVKLFSIRAIIVFHKPNKSHDLGRFSIKSIAIFHNLNKSNDLRMDFTSTYSI